jgi:hypothetical protein
MKNIILVSILSMLGACASGPMSYHEAQYYQNFGQFLWNAGAQERNSTPDWKIEQRPVNHGCTPVYNHGGQVVGCL